MTTWENSRSEFNGTWDLLMAPSFTLTNGPGAEDMVVTPRGARGLLDEHDHAANLDSSSGTVWIIFELQSAGVSNNKKALTFVSPADAFANIVAEGPQSTDPDWATSADSFDGTWIFSSSSRIVISGGHVQFIEVAGIKNGAYQAAFEPTAGSSPMLTITFGLQNDGYVDDDSSKPKMVDFIYPAIQLDLSTPTESERYEENGSGGGGY